MGDLLIWVAITQYGMDPLFAIKRIINLIVVALAAWLLSFFLNLNTSWFLYVAFLLSLIPLDTSIFKQLCVVVLTGCILVLSVALSSVLVFHWIAIIAILLITFLCMLAVLSLKKYRYPIFLINLTFVLILCLPPVLLTPNMLLGKSIALGALVAALGQLVLMANYKKDQANSWFKTTVSALEELTGEIFSCFQQSYKDNQYLYEHRLHDAKIKFLQALNQLRRFSNADNLKIIKLENLFTILIDCSQLRARITDFTIFEVCRADLIAIEKIMRQLLQGIRQHHDLEEVRNHPNIETTALLALIAQFEGTYQSVLRVTAHEPLVFLLFILDLKAFSEVIDDN